MLPTLTAQDGECEYTTTFYVIRAPCCAKPCAFGHPAESLHFSKAHCGSLRAGSTSKASPLYPQPQGSECRPETLSHPSPQPVNPGVLLLPFKPLAYAYTRRHPSAFPVTSALPARRTSGLVRSTCPGRLSTSAARQEIH